MIKLMKIVRVCCIVQFVMVGIAWLLFNMATWAFFYPMGFGDILLCLWPYLAINCGIPAFFLAKMEPTKRRATACAALLLPIAASIVGAAFFMIIIL